MTDDSLPKPPPAQHRGGGAAVAVIPARLASTRFPGKMLAADTGRPLVQHVVDRVRRCRLVDEVIVAVDDERIAAALRPFGTKVVLTRPDHPSGTDRVAEVARGLDAGIILNVQGDEPEMEPEAVDALVELMRRTPSAEMATLATPFPPDQDASSPDLVKVVVGRDGRALYFSRSPIPYYRSDETTERRSDEGAERDMPGGPPAPSGSGSGPSVAPSLRRSVAPLLHIGLYGYRRPFLLKLAEYAPTPLEEAEKLEQLRVLEYGHTIVVAVVDRSAHGIDTPRQYAEFVKREKARIAQRGPETASAAETRGPSET